MISWTMKKRICDAIENSEDLQKKMVEGLQAQAEIVRTAYKLQMPVDKGFARNSVEIVATKEGFKVASMAGATGNLATKSTNFGYPKYVHEGTYDYKGQKDYGYVTGYTRMHGKGFHNSKGKKGIRPNWFAYRASEEASPKVIKQFYQQILPLFK